MEIETQLNLGSNPLAHQIRHLYELVNACGRFVRAPETGWSRLISRVTHALQHRQSLTGRLPRLVRHVSDTPMCVDTDPVAHVAAQQHVRRHTEVLPRDVPHCRV